MGGNWCPSDGEYEQGSECQGQSLAQVPDVPFLSAWMSEEPSLTMRTVTNL